MPNTYKTITNLVLTCCVTNLILTMPYSLTIQSRFCSRRVSYTTVRWQQIVGLDESSGAWPTSMSKV